MMVGGFMYVIIIIIIIIIRCAEELGVRKGTRQYCDFFAEMTGLEGYDCDGA